MQSLNNIKYTLTCQEISDLMCSGGPAPKEFIVKTISKWGLCLHDLTVICVANSKGIWNWIATMKTNYDFLLDPHGDTFIADLMKLSLSHNILMLRQQKTDFSLKFKVYLGESKDGSTNIDADVVEAFQKAIGRQLS